MAKIHEIGIGADTRGFEDQIKSGIVKPTEDAADALDRLGEATGDVGDASDKAGGEVNSFASKLVDASRKAGKSDDDIKDALRNMGLSARQAERAVEDIGDEFKETGREGDRAADKLEDALRDVQKQSQKTERSVDDIGGKGFGKLKDGAQEVTQEVGQNLGEAVSSIRGDLSDLGQVGQDTLGGLAATLAGSGPAGIAGAAALAAGAVGLGLVTAEIQEQNERVQKLKQYFAEAWQEAVDGGNAYIDTATIIGEMNSIIFDPDRAEEYKRIQEDANKLGLDRQTLLQAAAGDQESLNVVTERTNQLVDEQNKLVTDSDDIRTKGRGPKEAAAAQELDALDQINDRWRQYGEINDENRQKAEDSATFTSDYLLKTVANAESATRAVDDFGNVLITLPTGQEIVIDAKTGKATTDVSKFKTDTDGVIDQLNGRDVVMSVATGDALRAAQSAVDTINNMSATVTVRANVYQTIRAVQDALSGWDS